MPRNQAEEMLSQEVPLRAGLIPASMERRAGQRASDEDVGHGAGEVGQRDEIAEESKITPLMPMCAAARPSNHRQQAGADRDDPRRW